MFRSQPHRLKEDEQFRAESEEFSSMMQKWMDPEYKSMLEKMTKMEKKGIPYYAFGNSAPRGEKHLYQSALMFR